MNNETNKNKEQVAVGSDSNDGLGDGLTLEQRIEARDTKIALLQGTIRFYQETAAENSRIKAEDHATITRYREALKEILYVSNTIAEMENAAHRALNGST